MIIRELIQYLEHIFPLALQEDFDNSGIQVGDINSEIKGVLLSIDVTENVVDEAISLGCNLIISHHPIAFKPFKSLTGKNYVERTIIKAIRNNISLYAAHTNLDNVAGGVNFKIAELLGLKNVRILQPKSDFLLKFVTFVPKSHAEILRNALFKAGAGAIGDYESCSFNTYGQGTFKPNDTANPFIGDIGKVNFEEEIRIETILPKFKKEEILTTLFSIHPYEEPAYDFYQLNNSWMQSGSGAVGTFPEPIEEQDFLLLLKDIFKLNSIQHSKNTGKNICDVAICGGSGNFLIKDAIDYGADAFITGEAKYNDFYDAQNKILLSVIGHYESEICTKNIFYDIISKKYNTFAIYLSAFDSNPVNYL